MYGRPARWVSLLHFWLGLLISWRDFRSDRQFRSTYFSFCVQLFFFAVITFDIFVTCDIFQFLKIFSNFYSLLIYFFASFNTEVLSFQYESERQNERLCFNTFSFIPQFAVDSGTERCDASVRKLFSHTELTTTCFFRSLAAVISSSLSVSPPGRCDEPYFGTLLAEGCEMVNKKLKSRIKNRNARREEKRFFYLISTYYVCFLSGPGERCVYHYFI